MEFTEVQPVIDHGEYFAMKSKDGDRLVLYKVLYGYRVRIYPAYSPMRSITDWCVGKNQELAERLWGFMLAFLGNDENLDRLWDVQNSERRPIHNDPAFLKRVLDMMDEPFEPYVLPKLL